MKMFYLPPPDSNVLQFNVFDEFSKGENFVRRNLLFM